MAFLNTIIIVVIVYCILKMVCNNKCEQKMKVIVCLLSFTLLIMMYNFKSLIYWVAGSVNYLWVCCFILIYCYLFKEKNIFKYRKTNIFLLFILSTLHENSFVFFFIFILVLNIKEYIENKKISYCKYIFPVLFGGAILLLSPGQILRNAGYQEWYAMSFFNRLNISIPSVSKNIFELFNPRCIIPTIYIFILLIRTFLLKTKKVFRFSFIILILLFSLTSYFNLFRYSYFVLAIVLFINELYIHIEMKEYNIIPIQFGFYAIDFSMVITPLYNSQRPNILLYIYFILIICKFIIEILKHDYSKIILIIILLFSLLIAIYFEVDIYYNIGSIYNKRLSQIEEFKKNNDEVLYLTKIPEKYASFHPDCNNINEEHWTYRFFLWYYDLPEGTKMIYVE